MTDWNSKGEGEGEIEKKREIGRERGQRRESGAERFAPTTEIRTRTVAGIGTDLCIGIPIVTVRRSGNQEAAATKLPGISDYYYY
eukprot:143885-Rhodomonas_salina.1